MQQATARLQIQTMYMVKTIFFQNPSRLLSHTAPKENGMQYNTLNYNSAATQQAAIEAKRGST